jgi:pseudaminic acid cytidylyltransferase
VLYRAIKRIQGYRQAWQNGDIDTVIPVSEELLQTVRTLCVIPARGGSKRLERKNVRNLNGKPLLAYTVEAALESGVFDRTIVSTEDEEIADIAREYGATVPFQRPAELATDTAQVVDVVDHVIEYYDDCDETFEELGVLFPTSPLRTAADVRDAYQLFCDRADASFLMSVTEYQYSPVQALQERDGMLTPYWDNDEVVTSRSQDQPDLVVSNGAIYFMETDAYRTQRTFYGDSLIGYRMPPERSVDIDEQFDLELAEFILNRA